MLVDKMIADSQRRNAESVAGACGLVLVATPSFAAAPATITDVSDVVTALGGIATAAVVVVLSAMGARMAIKLVNRVAVKG